MKLIITCLFSFVLSACSNFPYVPEVEQGTPINTAEFKKIHTGDNESQVVSILGQPSFKHIDHNNQWYYMVENNQFKKPLVYKLVFQDHKLQSLHPNQSV